MEELIERAKKFLEDNLSINEVELQDGSLRVHLIRFTPAPLIHQGQWYTPGLLQKSW